MTDRIDGYLLGIMIFLLNGLMLFNLADMFYAVEKLLK